MRLESFFDSARAISIRAREFQRLQCHEVPMVALWVIFGVVRNAALSSVLAWLAVFLCSLGAAPTPVREQSYSTFVAAIIFWTHLLLSAVTLVTLALVLQSQRFIDAPDVAPTLRYCFWKLTKRTYLQFLVSLMFMLSATYLLGFGSPSLHAVKLEYYLNCLLSHLFTTYADLMTRRIVRDETVQGMKYAAAKQNAQLDGCYVHAICFVSRTHLQRHFELFVVGSTLFKVGVQEIAKWVSLRRTVKDIRIMCVAVGIPTVLIDTQIRNEDVERRKRKILAFQSAESYADMSGEFISIGCSASIVYFFGSHPKYSFDRIVQDDNSRSGSHDSISKAIASSQLLLALFQVGVEIVVDWVSTMLETCGGLDFKELIKHRGFLASFFMTLAIVNIQTSAVVYAVWDKPNPNTY